MQMSTNTQTVAYLSLALLSGQWLSSASEFLIHSTNISWAHSMNQALFEVFEIHSYFQPSLNL